MPKEKYAYATEILEHSQRIGRAYGLYEKRYSRPVSRSCAGMN